MRENNMEEGFSNDKYGAYTDSDKTYRYLNKIGSPDDKTGWKIHISLSEDENNIDNAWLLVKDILKKYGVNLSKVLIQGNSLNEYQSGKQITIYYQSSLSEEKWLEMLHEITNIFVINGIKPGYKPISDLQLNGSVYFSCRTDCDAEGREVSAYHVATHNPSGRSHLFEKLKIDPSQLRGEQPKKPLRQNEEQIKKSYQDVDSLFNAANNLIYNSLKEKITGKQPRTESESSGEFEKKYKRRVDWKLDTVVQDIIEFLKEIFHDLNDVDELKESLLMIKKSYDEFHGKGFGISAMDKQELALFEDDIKILSENVELLKLNMEGLVTDAPDELSEKKKEVRHFAIHEGEQEQKHHSKREKSSHETSSSQREKWSKSHKESLDEESDSQEKKSGVEIVIPIPESPPKKSDLASSEEHSSEEQDHSNSSSDEESTSCCSCFRKNKK
jgi:hypothetical protein